MKVKQNRAVCLIADYDGKIPMLFRKNTGFMDEYWSLIAGRVEKNESIMEAMIRETKEESGLRLLASDLELIHICNRLQKYNKEEIYKFNWIDAYFYTKNLSQEPINNEPDKHSEIKMFAMDNLPENTLPYVKFAIKAYLKNKIYSEYGF
ncbi:NUDIX domain-containing protein [Candidatus Parcubacteria bacterium]|nr:NUDIX domain-containing protein [Candidatus Parcubacteria bacterium]